MRGMRPDAVLRSLCTLAERAGVEIRIEPFEAILGKKGGLCRIEGRPVILVDARLALLDQVGVVGQALGALDLGGAVPVNLVTYLETGHGRVKPLPRPIVALRPLARGRPRH